MSRTVTILSVLIGATAFTLGAISMGLPWWAIALVWALLALFIAIAWRRDFDA